MELFTRREHGLEPVRVVESDTHQEYHVGSNEVKVFESFRAFARAMYGYGSGWTRERYFRLDKSASHQESCPVWELVEIHQESQGKQLGIDLVNRSDEVAKLLQAACGDTIRAYGYNFDDVLQEVYKGMLVRNEGTCPWDPDISTFGHYVTMVCKCIFANYHKKQQRIRGREQIGVRALGADGFEIVDVAEVADSEVDATAWSKVKVLEALEDLVESFDSVEGSHKAEARLARRIIPMVMQGMRRSEIAEHVTVGPASVGRALAWLRKATEQWLERGDTNEEE